MVRARLYREDVRSPFYDRGFSREFSVFFNDARFFFEIPSCAWSSIADNTIGGRCSRLSSVRSGPSSGRPRVGSDGLPAVFDLPPGEKQVRRSQGVVSRNASLVNRRASSVNRRALLVNAPRRGVRAWHWLVAGLRGPAPRRRRAVRRSRRHVDRLVGPVRRFGCGVNRGRHAGNHSGGDARRFACVVRRFDGDARRRCRRAARSAAPSADASQHVGR